MQPPEEHSDWSATRSAGRSHFIACGVETPLANVVCSAQQSPETPCPRVWPPGLPAPAMKNMAVEFGARTETHVDLVAGPTSTWQDRAIGAADVIFSGSENAGADAILAKVGWTR